MTLFEVTDKHPSEDEYTSFLRDFRGGNEVIVQSQSSKSSTNNKQYHTSHDEHNYTDAQSRHGQSDKKNNNRCGKKLVSSHDKENKRYSSSPSKRIDTFNTMQRSAVFSSCKF